MLGINLSLMIVFFCSREYNLDKEVAASGYSKEVEEFDSELRRNEKNDDELENENENDGDSISEEIEEENSDSVDEIENDDGESNGEDESENFKGDNDNKKSDFISIKNNSTDGADIVETNNKLDKESARLKLISEMSKLRQVRRGIEDEEDQIVDNSEPTLDTDDICSVRSFSTTASTISPNMVKHRMRRDLEKQKKREIPKKNLRVKGEANAYNRIKKQNKETIKGSVGWDYDFN